MTVNDIFRNTVVAQYIPSGERWIYTLDYRQTAFVSFLSEAAQCVEIASDIFAETNTEYFQNIVNDSVSLLRVECFIINKPLFFGQSVQASTTGAVIGDILPLRSSPVWNKLTGLRGRSFRGRNFLFPLPEAQQNGSIMTALAQTTLQDYGDGLLTRDVVSGDQYKLTVYSPTLSDPPMDIFLDNIVTTIPINTRLKTRKSRDSD